jgi:flagellar basal body-associated protein FliL
VISRTKIIIAVILIVLLAAIAYVVWCLNKIEDTEMVNGGTLVEIPLWTDKNV